MGAESTKKALERYYQKQLDPIKPRKKNTSPEKDFERELLAYLRPLGFSLSVVDSKAVYHPTAGTYLTQKAETGFPDLCGCTQTGIGAFIELKAPGKLSNLSAPQRNFLLEKAKLGAFACVVDSIARFKEIYQNWAQLPLDQRPDYLISTLPRARIEKLDNFDLK